MKNLTPFHGMSLGTVLAGLKATSAIKLIYAPSKGARRLIKIRIGADCYLTISDDIKVTNKTIGTKASKKLLGSCIINKDKYTPTKGWLNLPDGSNTTAGELLL